MIYLKYSNDNWVSETALTFNELLFNEIPVKKVITGTTLKYAEFSHREGTKSAWVLIITADELIDSTKYTNIKLFWEAAAKKFSLDNWVSETVVVDTDEEFPVEYCEEGNISFPEVTLNLLQKHADV